MGILTERKKMSFSHLCISVIPYLIGTKFATELSASLGNLHSKFEGIRSSHFRDTSCQSFIFILCFFSFFVFSHTCWMPSRTPSHCACGINFSVDHAQSCPKGGFPSIRHNEVRDITAELLSEVCHDVEVEPHLQPLSDERFQQKTANTQDGARLDIAMNGFWGGRYEKCYTDVRVFNPLAPSNSGTTLQSFYRKH